MVRVLSVLRRGVTFLASTVRVTSRRSILRSRGSQFLSLLIPVPPTEMTIPSPPDPDDDTLARVARCEPNAIRAFVKQFTPRVSVKLASLGLAEHERDDLTNEVLLEAIQKIGAYRRGKGRFITWLLTITKRRGIDYRRRRRWIKEDGGYVPREVSLEALEDSARRGKQAGEVSTVDEKALIAALDRQRARVDVPGVSPGATLLERAASDLEEWLAARPEADRIAAQGLLFGTPWAKVAEDLSRFRGRPVNANAAKQHGDRLKKQIRKDLAYLFGQTDDMASATAGDSERARIDLEGVE